MRYGHNTERVLGLPAQSVALLSTLVLRGPQTAAELRLNGERLHRFADISAVEAFLHELAERSAGPLVTELPRMPGTRETRWAHLLTGAPVASTAPATHADGDASTRAMPSGNFAMEIAALRAEVAELASTVAELRAAVAFLRDGGRGD